ncbi:hypothetical protein MES4922_490013 [Mesorhizobium ventifaucium]|uniref:Uncharacterized protein n=1 Tax=Mesorhizobium ventifaucium TaxID=666020 RepID=A0ABM9EAJ0_9HYPH|nr:hypothetical protein MES4922_490013 [Mesorhizobium ventifaucium]
MDVSFTATSFSFVFPFADTCICNLLASVIC